MQPQTYTLCTLTIQWNASGGLLRTKGGTDGRSSPSGHPQYLSQRSAPGSCRSLAATAR